MMKGVFGPLAVPLVIAAFAWGTISSTFLMEARENARFWRDAYMNITLHLRAADMEKAMKKLQDDLDGMKKDRSFKGWYNFDDIASTNLYNEWTNWTPVGEIELCNRSGK